MPESGAIVRQRNRLFPHLQARSDRRRPAGRVRRCFAGGVCGRSADAAGARGAARGRGRPPRATTSAFLVALPTHGAPPECGGEAGRSGAAVRHIGTAWGCGAATAFGGAPASGNRGLASRWFACLGAGGLGLRSASVLGLVGSGAVGLQAGSLLVAGGHQNAVRREPRLEHLETCQTDQPVSCAMSRCTSRVPLVLGPMCQCSAIGQMGWIVASLGG